MAVPGPRSEIVCVSHGAVGLAGSGHPNASVPPTPPVAKTISGLPSPSMSRIGCELARDLRQHRVLGPAAVLALRIYIEVHRPRLAGEHVGPAVAGKVIGVVDHRASEAGARRLGRSNVDFHARRVGRAEVVVGTRHHIEHAVVVEVGCRCPPGVIELVEPLHPEPRGNLSGVLSTDVKILEGDILEANFSAAAGVQRNRTVFVPLIRYAGYEVVRLIQDRTDDVRVHRDTQQIPVVRDGCPAAAESARPAASAA